jgi:hypothetical protein
MPSKETPVSTKTNPAVAPTSEVAVEATKPTFGEIVDSFTGGEEMDLWTAFEGSAPLTARWQQRLAIFVLKRRDGLSVSDARKFVLDLRAADIDDYFGADAEDEDDPDEPQPLGKPETDAGKGDEQPEE